MTLSQRLLLSVKATTSKLSNCNRDLSGSVCIIRLFPAIIVAVLMTFEETPDIRKTLRSVAQTFELDFISIGILSSSGATHA